MMNLTADNYYTHEANREYMSCSQYQDFLSCEAKALAKVEGRWEDKGSEAFLVGNYFHTHFESPESHEKFCNEHLYEIFKTRESKQTGVITITGKKAPYVKADEMITVMENDPVMKQYIDMPGENEKIMTGKLFGWVPWRIRLDKYVPDKHLILDYKTCANIQECKWNPITRQRETFVELYGYMMRAAVYCEIEKQFMNQDDNAAFILLCVSKQDYPDKELVLLNHESRMEYELDQIKERIYRIMEIKSHRQLPTRCGYCDYCRATKRIKQVVPYYGLAPEFKESRETDYAIATEDFFAALQT